MAKYRFPCPKCGHVATVSEDQAGASFRCAECGAVATLPTLMQIRRLEPDAGPGYASSDPARIERARSRRGWAAGLFTIGIALVLFGAAGAVGFWYVRSTIEIVEIDRDLLEDAYQEVRDATAAQAFEMWTQARELRLESVPHTKPLHIQNREQYATMGTAIVVSLIALAVGVALAIAGGWALLGAELQNRDASRT